MPSSTLSTSARCACVSGCATSRTCRITSASATSSSVARKAATSSVGSSLMKPTVSDRITRRPEGSTRPRIVGSSVANSWSSACTCRAGQRVEQRRLAGIGVADQRHHRERHAPPRRAMQAARAAHLLELALEPHDAVADQAAVGLDLRLAGAAEEAEAAALPLEMGPGPHQPAALVVEMRELDLQRAFAASPRARRRCRGSARCGRSPCRPSARSRLRCCTGVSAASTMTTVDLLVVDGPPGALDLALAEQGRRPARAQRDDRGMDDDRARSRPRARPPRRAAPPTRGPHPPPGASERAGRSQGSTTAARVGPAPRLSRRRRQRPSPLACRRRAGSARPASRC